MDDSSAIMIRLEAAASEYIALRDRRMHPATRNDHGRRYLVERYSCCAGIRPPSRAYPWSESHHGRTVTHVASKYGLDAGLLRRAVYAIEHIRPLAPIVAAHVAKQLVSTS